MKLCRNFLWISLLAAAACSQARAITWFPEGPDGGDARSFAADPKDHNHIYLGSTNGWIYQTIDGGLKWSRLARLGNRDDLVVDNIVVDPANPKHIVAGAYVIADGGDVYVSNDGGATWTAQPDMKGQSVRSLTDAPSDPNILFAGTLTGVFRSTDGGMHWEQISPKGSVEIHEIESLAVDPTNPDVIYAGTWHLPWKTTDGGKTWKNIKQGIIDDSDVFSIIVDPKQSNVVYASACSGIYKSTDAGTKFSKVQGIPSTARRTRVLMQDPNHLDTVFAGTTEGLYRTFDAGKYWMQTTGSQIIVNDVYVDPTNSKHVLLATDRGGVLLSNDGGDSFAPSNIGFSAQHITSFVQDSQHPATVYVGVVNDKEFGGVFMSRTGGLSWSRLNSGLDGRDVFSLAQAPDGSILAGTEHGIFRLKDGLWQSYGTGSGTTIEKAPTAVARKRTTRTSRGGRARVAAAHVASRGAEVKSFDGSVYSFARSGDTVFAATSQGMLNSVSSGVNWTTVPSIPADEYWFAAAANTNLVAASLTGLEMSSDSGNTWHQLSLPPQVQQVSAVSVDGRGCIWVADRNGVYYTMDRGATWKPVSDIYVRNVNSLYYDEHGQRMLVTSSGPATQAFAVEIPSMRVISWDTGWKLRFLRPVGDYLLGATLYDGAVVQPRWVDSAVAAKH